MTATARRVSDVIACIKKNLECPICLELLNKPVSTRCAHQFCRFCITEFLQTKSSVSCPLCKKPVTKRSLQQRDDLSEIVDNIRDLITAFQADSGTIFSPPRGPQIVRSLHCTPELVQPKQSGARKRNVRQTGTRRKLESPREITGSDTRNAESDDPQPLVELPTSPNKDTSKRTELCDPCPVVEPPRIQNKDINRTETSDVQPLEKLPRTRSGSRQQLQQSRTCRQKSKRLCYPADEQTSNLVEQVTANRVSADDPLQTSESSVAAAELLGYIDNGSCGALVKSCEIPVSKNDTENKVENNKPMCVFDEECSVQAVSPESNDDPMPLFQSQDIALHEKPFSCEDKTFHFKDQSDNSWSSRAGTAENCQQTESHRFTRSHSNHPVTTENQEKTVFVTKNQEETVLDTENDSPEYSNVGSHNDMKRFLKPDLAVKTYGKKYVGKVCHKDVMVKHWIDRLPHKIQVDDQEVDAVEIIPLCRLPPDIEDRACIDVTNMYDRTASYTEGHVDVLHMDLSDGFTKDVSENTQVTVGIRKRIFKSRHSLVQEPQKQITMAELDSDPYEFKSSQTPQKPKAKAKPKRKRCKAKKALKIPLHVVEKKTEDDLRVTSKQMTVLPECSSAVSREQSCVYDISVNETSTCTKSIVPDVSSKDVHLNKTILKEDKSNKKAKREKNTKKVHWKDDDKEMNLLIDKISQAEDHDILFNTQDAIDNMATEKKDVVCVDVEEVELDYFDHEDDDDDTYLIVRQDPDTDNKGNNFNKEEENSEVTFLSDVVHEKEVHIASGSDFMMNKNRIPETNVKTHQMQISVSLESKTNVELDSCELISNLETVVHTQKPVDVPLGVTPVAQTPQIDKPQKPAASPGITVVEETSQMRETQKPVYVSPGMTVVAETPLTGTGLSLLRQSKSRTTENSELVPPTPLVSCHLLKKATSNKKNRSVLEPLSATGTSSVIKNLTHHSARKNKMVDQSISEKTTQNWLGDGSEAEQEDDTDSLDSSATEDMDTTPPDFDFEKPNLDIQPEEIKFWLTQMSEDCINPDPMNEVIYVSDSDELPTSKCLLSTRQTNVQMSSVEGSNINLSVSCMSTIPESIDPVVMSRNLEIQVGNLAASSAKTKTGDVGDEVTGDYQRTEIHAVIQNSYSSDSSSVKDRRNDMSNQSTNDQQRTEVCSPVNSRFNEHSKTKKLSRNKLKLNGKSRKDQSDINVALANDHDEGAVRHLSNACQIDSSGNVPPTFTTPTPLMKKNENGGCIQRKCDDSDGSSTVGSTHMSSEILNSCLDRDNILGEVTHNFGISDRNTPAVSDYSLDVVPCTSSALTSSLCNSKVESALQGGKKDSITTSKSMPGKDEQLQVSVESESTFQTASDQSVSILDPISDFCNLENKQICRKPEVGVCSVNQTVVSALCNQKDKKVSANLQDDVCSGNLTLVSSFCNLNEEHVLSNEKADACSKNQTVETSQCLSSSVDVSHVTINTILTDNGAVVHHKSMTDDNDHSLYSEDVKEYPVLVDTQVEMANMVMEDMETPLCRKLRSSLESSRSSGQKRKRKQNDVINDSDSSCTTITANESQMFSEKSPIVSEDVQLMVTPSHLITSMCARFSQISSDPVPLLKGDSDDEILHVRRSKRRCFSLDGSPVKAPDVCRRSRKPRNSKKKNEINMIELEEVESKKTVNKSTGYENDVIMASSEIHSIHCISSDDEVANSVRNSEVLGEIPETLSESRPAASQQLSEYTLLPSVDVDVPSASYVLGTGQYDVCVAAKESSTTIQDKLPQEVAAEEMVHDESSVQSNAKKNLHKEHTLDANASDSVTRYQCPPDTAEKSNTTDIHNYSPEPVEKSNTVVNHHEHSLEPDEKSNTAVNRYEHSSEPDEQSNTAINHYEHSPEPGEQSNTAINHYEHSPEPDEKSNTAVNHYEHSPEPDEKSNTAINHYEHSPEPGEQSNTAVNHYEHSPEPGEQSNTAVNHYEHSPEPGEQSNTPIDHYEHSLEPDEKSNTAVNHYEHSPEPGEQSNTAINHYEHSPEPGEQSNTAVNHYEHSPEPGEQSNTAVNHYEHSPEPGEQSNTAINHYEHSLEPDEKSNTAVNHYEHSPEPVEISNTAINHCEHSPEPGEQSKSAINHYENSEPAVVVNSDKIQDDHPVECTVIDLDAPECIDMTDADNHECCLRDVAGHDDESTLDNCEDINGQQSSNSQKSLSQDIFQISARVPRQFPEKFSPGRINKICLAKDSDLKPLSSDNSSDSEQPTERLKRRRKGRRTIRGLALSKHSGNSLSKSSSASILRNRPETNCVVLSPSEMRPRLNFSPCRGQSSISSVMLEQDSIVQDTTGANCVNSESVEITDTNQDGSTGSLQERARSCNDPKRDDHHTSRKRFVLSVQKNKDTVMFSPQNISRNIVIDNGVENLAQSSRLLAETMRHKQLQFMSPKFTNQKNLHLHTIPDDEKFSNMQDIAYKQLRDCNSKKLQSPTQKVVVSSNFGSNSEKPISPIVKVTDSSECIKHNSEKIASPTLNVAASSDSTKRNSKKIASPMNVAASSDATKHNAEKRASPAVEVLDSSDSEEFVLEDEDRIDSDSDTALQDLPHRLADGEEFGDVRLCDPIVIHDLQSDENKYRNLPQTSSPIEDESKLGYFKEYNSSEDESVATPVRMKKKKKRCAVIEDSDEEDDSVLSQNSNINHSQNLTSSSAFSSQSEVLTTQQKDLLETDCAKLKEKILAAEARIQDIATKTPGSVMKQTQTRENDKTEHRPQTLTDSPLRSLSVIPATGSDDGNNSSSSSESDDLFFSPLPPTPPPPETTSSHGKPSDVVKEVVHILNKIRSPDSTKDVRVVLNCGHRDVQEKPDVDNQVMQGKLDVVQEMHTLKNSISSGLMGKDKHSVSKSPQREATSTVISAWSHSASLSGSGSLLVNKGDERTELPTIDSTRLLTGKTKRSPLLTKPSCSSFVATGLGRNEVVSVQRLAESNDCKFYGKYNNRVTHVIVKTVDEHHKMCDRTLKYFQGVAAKCYIVGFQWVVDSLEAGRLLPEDAYEITGDSVSDQIHYGPSRSRSTSSKLLSGFNLTCVGVSTEMTRDDMVELLSLCGADVAEDPWELGTLNNSKKKLIIRCLDMEDDPPSLSEVDFFNSHYKHLGVVTVSREWALDSISVYQIQPLSDYILTQVNDIQLPF